MAESGSNFLKAAFQNVYNLSLLGGSLAVAVMTGDWFVGAAALGVEALWLLLGPDFKPFQRAVRNSEREERERQEQLRIEKMSEALPERDWQRAKALAELKKEIQRDMENNPSFEAILLEPEVEKLKHLHASFVFLANACSRAETYLGAVDMKELQRQLHATAEQERLSKDPTVTDIAQKNRGVLEKRVKSIEEIRLFLTRARGQMQLIENTVRLLRDQVLTMASPSQVGEQLSDLLIGVDALAETARENDLLLARATGLSPISDVTGAEAEKAPAERVGVKT